MSEGVGWHLDFPLSASFAFPPEQRWAWCWGGSLGAAGGGSSQVHLVQGRLQGGWLEAGSGFGMCWVVHGSLSSVKAAGSPGEGGERGAGSICTFSLVKQGGEGSEQCSVQLS